jgi:hypothetical protein
MRSRDIHLNEERLICSVVDQNDLSADEQNHLFTCSVCQGEKQQLEQELTNLGRMAKEFAPLPEKNIIPLLQESLQKPRSSWSWRPVFAAGFVVILLIVGIWMYSPFKRYQEYKIAKLIERMKDDEKLMAEIRSLEEQALSGFYMDISGESYRYVDDEFLEFILPLEENHNSI